ncbi:NUDIX hydrolase [Streptomyces bambusae]|uniref:NUDIX domain-containing protein n=1 Tax=Streptomyces bambusae TaxID=1550616 RepID=UPI001CFFB4EA|nr:NUDIX hydrolase [Streptomyces bambusae]MCB5169826.1 NUDIX hydrolase [Streptomyces bambusae]
MTATWLPPREYIATLPQNTAYACLYFTDREGRPVQLRAAYRTEPWQWPGGNMDPGETPWQTAVRECREETGIAFRGEPRLLGFHFLAPRGEEWPSNHMGVIFDGGILTDEEIAGIVLDPAEHSELRVATLTEWEEEMAPADFERLARIDRARRTGTVAYLETGSFD